MAEKEAQEIVILEKYLPEQMDSAQVESVVKEVIASMNATSMKEMGSVMKEVLAKTGGQADNKLVSQLVRGLLS